MGDPLERESPLDRCGGPRRRHIGGGTPHKGRGSWALYGGPVLQVGVPHRKGGYSIHKTVFNPFVGSTSFCRTSLWSRTSVKNLPGFLRM